MKRFFALCLVAVAFATAPAFSDGLDRGVVAYDKGDYATALREFRPLAVEGDSIAQYFVGEMYENGKGVIQDYKEAVKWYRLSVRKGNTFAQNDFGVMYAKGHGVQQDYVRAHMWLNLAASKGVEKASRNRDAIAKEMTSAQIEKAQDLAKKCVARNYQEC